MVRMNKPIRSFCSAKTCSTRERIFDLALVYLTVQRASRSFWRSFAGLSFQSSGMRPVLDRLLLVLGVALTRSGDQARIDDLARHGDVPGLPKRCIEALEQWPDGAGLREFLPEQPNRPGVGDATRQSKSEKTHE